MRTKKIVPAFLALAFLPVAARMPGNDALYIEEVMAGANGDARLQFLVVRQVAVGENLWGPQEGESQSRAMLVVYDGFGRETGTFRFPEDPPTGGSLRTLIATETFAAQPGAPEPDVVIPPLLNSLDGEVCIRNNPRNLAAAPMNECVTYGRFTGEMEPNHSAGNDPAVNAGPPAPSLPITDTMSLFRARNTGHNSDFTVRTAPTPENIAGDTFRIPVASRLAQGRTLFENETFSGNGRTCASCHVADDSFGLTPANVRSRFASMRDSSSFDPLFIGETSPSGFDAGFDFNLNTLELTSEVATPAPCTGDLRGDITASNGARARVLARTSPTTYLVYGGLVPRLAGTVSDGLCSATVRTISAGDLDAIEDPARLRGAEPAFPEGRALILENVDGQDNPPVFRRSPHLLNLAYSAPYGFSGDIPDLGSFTTGAVVQHLPRTLNRSQNGPDPDFRLPTPDELAAMEAFMMAQEFPSGDDPDKFDLARYATTDAQRRGREEFVVFGCAACHGGPTLDQTTVSIQGKEVGVNAAFNTGTTAGRFRGALPCEPGTPEVGPCGSREISTPQLFNLPNLGPYFHNGSAATLADAVNFYNSSEFGNSPVNQALIAQGIGVVPTDEIIAFLKGLVGRPYILSPQSVEIRTEATIEITNTSDSPLRFDSSACRLTGPDGDAFRIASCPLSPMLAPGESQTIEVAFNTGSEGPRTAILEVHPLDVVPSGVDVMAVGRSGL